MTATTTTAFSCLRPVDSLDPLRSAGSQLSLDKLHDAISASQAEYPARPRPSQPTPSAVPTPKNMNDLIAHIKQEMGPHGLDSSAIDISRITQLMSNYSSNAQDWSQFALFDPYRYTRNLVDDGNGQFNLLVICWGPGHVSPIHDHANSHCCMKLLDGELLETRYEFPDGQTPSDHVPGVTEMHDDKGLKMLGETTMGRDQVVYINDSLGLHRVSNLSAKPAISLHLYSPPIELCHTYCERTGLARPASQCVYYSVGGKRVLPACVQENKQQQQQQQDQGPILGAGCPLRPAVTKAMSTAASTVCAAASAAARESGSGMASMRP
ncbi:RmlC-like cupin domain-containing protein [Catenaria anguillulae PL171]|uniref:Cysteine dioxygenase n=1 Tax=Catenaria anguillulae PL171 TaxID=765915 RepID=A0A1Y2HQU3_9FUNG|nr:RmlC-like cupin domain-containing protein [Catenaria anguillulae PL171]